MILDIRDKRDQMIRGIQEIANAPETQEVQYALQSIIWECHDLIKKINDDKKRDAQTNQAVVA
jgi:hypothetical protein